MRMRTELNNVADVAMWRDVFGSVDMDNWMIAWLWRNMCTKVHLGGVRACDQSSVQSVSH